MKILDLDCFINETKLETLLFDNENSRFENDGPSAYINMYKICNLMNILINIKQNKISFKSNKFDMEKYINGNDKNIKKIIIDISKTNNKFCFYGKNNKLVKEEEWNEEVIKIIDKIYYIQFSIIRYFMNGSFKQTNDRIIYYTHDYERMDIPETLLECYEYFSKNLDKKLIKKIRLDKNIDLHFTLGLWIRNNWIYPGHNRIEKLFKNTCIYDADSKSSAILEGYHYFLNGINKTINELDGVGMLEEKMDNEDSKELDKIIGNFKNKIITLEEFEYQFQKKYKSIMEK